jgi:hypothetical protein
MSRARGSDSEFEAIVVKDLRTTDAFQKTYTDLKAKAFPVSVFEPELLCRRSVWPSPGDRVHVCQIQLNFIEGGLILTWSISTCLETAKPSVFGRKFGQRNAGVLRAWKSTAPLILLHISATGRA